jgi:hypothetical protein
MAPKRKLKKKKQKKLYFPTLHQKLAVMGLLRDGITVSNVRRIHGRNIIYILRIYYRVYKKADILWAI